MSGAPWSVVVLAAGLASRLGGAVPKALVPVLGEPLVGRLCRQAVELGAAEVVVVTGHRADEVEAALLASAVGTRLRFVRNPVPGESSLGWSCGIGLAAVQHPTVMVILGDTVTDDGLLADVLADGGVLALGYLDVPVDEESMKLRLVEGRPARMGKDLGPPVAGEYSGVLVARREGPAALRAAIARHHRNTDLCVGPLNDLLAALPVTAVDCSGHRWIEIDFPGDVTRMRGIFNTASSTPVLPRERR